MQYAWGCGLPTSYGWCIESGFSGPHVLDSTRMSTLVFCYGYKWDYLQASSNIYLSLCIYIFMLRVSEICNVLSENTCSYVFSSDGRPVASRQAAGHLRNTRSCVRFSCSSFESQGTRDPNCCGQWGSSLLWTQLYHAEAWYIRDNCVDYFKILRGYHSSCWTLVWGFQTSPLPSGGQTWQWEMAIGNLHLYIVRWIIHATAHQNVFFSQVAVFD